MEDFKEQITALRYVMENSITSKGGLKGTDRDVSLIFCTVDEPKS